MKSSPNQSQGNQENDFGQRSAPQSPRRGGCPGRPPTIFFLVALKIGGDAVNGRIVNGRYYVASHGKYTEVSKAVFTYSRYHVYSVWVTHSVGILALAGWLVVKEKRKKGSPGRRLDP